MLPKVNATAEPVIVFLAFFEHVLPREHTIRHGLITTVIAQHEPMILERLVHDLEQNTPDFSGVMIFGKAAGCHRHG